MQESPKKEPNGCLYVQLYERIKRDIVSGSFPYGSRLPSKRTMAEEANLSVITVKHAYELLCDEGYLEARERSGYYVAFRQEDGFAAYAEEGPLGRDRLGGESPATGKGVAFSAPPFPFSVLAKTMRRVMTEYGEGILERSPNKGRIELRSEIQRYLARNRGICVDIEQIVIGSGVEHLYGLIVELFGRGSVFALEYPSYEKIEDTYRIAGARVELLPMGADGIVSEALAKTSADVLHVSPYRSFPSGITASASKKHEYLRWAGQGRRFVVEDDFESEFSLFRKTKETIFALSGDDNVVYLNTFSQTISPSLRVGYMVLPRKLVQRYDSRLGFYSCTVPTFEQLLLAELIGRGDFERHVNRVRRGKRREAQ